jgi:type II secretion system protein H
MTFNSQSERAERSRQAGFTLVELMIVVAILAILAAIAVPNFIGSLPRQRLAKATRNLISDMQWVRQQAVTTNRPWQINFDTAADRYRIVDSADGIWGNGDDVTVRTVNLADYGSGVRYGLSSGITANWNDTALTAGSQQTTVTFNSRGLPSGSAERSTFLTNADNHLTYAVTRSAGGGLRLRMYNGILPFHRTHWIEK